MTVEAPSLRSFMHEGALPMFSVVVQGRYMYIPYRQSTIRMISTNIAADGSLMEGVPIRIFFHTKSKTMVGNEAVDVQDYVDVDSRVQTVQQILDNIFDLSRLLAFNELQGEMAYRKAVLAEQAKAATDDSGAALGNADLSADLPTVPQNPQPTAPVQDWDDAEEETTEEAEARAQRLLDETGAAADEEDDGPAAMVTNGATVVAPRRTRNRRH